MGRRKDATFASGFQRTHECTADRTGEKNGRQSQKTDFPLEDIEEVARERTEGDRADARPSRDDP